MKTVILLTLVSLLLNAEILAKQVRIKSTPETLTYHQFVQTGEQSRALEVIVLESKQIILFYGGFSSSGYAKAMKLISNLKKNVDTYLYLERGYGGSVKDHKKFVKAIQNKCSSKSGCLFTTHLAGQCSSMCTTLFLAGEKRIAESGANSKLGFHRTLIRVAGKNIPIRSQSAMARYFMRFRGVNKKYLKEHKHILFGARHNAISFVENQELLDSGFAEELTDLQTDKRSYLEKVHAITLQRD